MFAKRYLRSSDARHRPAAPQPAALFARYERKLRARVRSIVSTSEANIEDACMYAWLTLLRHDLDEVAEPYSWLTTIAVREAVKLDRADRRTRPLSSTSTAPRQRPGEELAAHDLLAHAAAIIQEAGLTARSCRSSRCSSGASATSRSRCTPATAAAPSSARSSGPAAKLAEALRGSSSNGVLLLGPREGIDFALAATWGTLLGTFVSVVWTA